MMKAKKNSKTTLKLVAFAILSAIVAICLFFAIKTVAKKDQIAETVLEDSTVSEAIEKLKAQETYEIPVKLDCEPAEYNPEGTIREKLDWLFPEAFNYLIGIYNEGFTTEEVFKLQLRPLFWIEDELSSGGLTEEEAYTMLILFFYEQDSDGDDEEFREIIDKEAEIFLPSDDDKEGQEKLEELLGRLSSFLDN